MDAMDLQSDEDSPLKMLFNPEVVLIWVQETSPKSVVCLSLV
jgi:hypothetical protein